MAWSICVAALVVVLGTGVGVLNEQRNWGAQREAVFDPRQDPDDVRL
jgi:hypothetical protein